MSPFQNANQYESSVYVKWNDLFMEIDRYAAGYRPGPAPRALGYMGYAAYEAVVPGMPAHNSLANLYSGLSIPQAEEADHYWPLVVNEVYFTMMERFFFHIKNDQAQLFNSIQSLRNELREQYRKNLSAEVFNRSEARGKAVGLAVYEWSATDLATHNGFLDPQPQGYVPPSGPGKWQPTFPDYSRAVFPYWGQGRTFAMKPSDKLAKPPIPYSEDKNSLFYSQAEEVFKRVQNIKANGPGAYEERWISEFWSDDILKVTFSPPTRLVAIANQIVAKERTDLATSAELYAKIGMAMNDAGVAVWYSKYVYNVERPVSYIRRILPAEYPEAKDFSSILNNPPAGYSGVTPAFPAYPSGHSGFGGAGGKILSSIFEFNSIHPGTFSFTDNCHKDRTDFIGSPRSFSSFRDMADEDAFSRIPLGVHFRMDCSEGVRLGELAAQRVLELPWKK
ncbi:MAG TPA: vanadium-dependent haloperoxidase [Saprospiraceae bacterium]|nr:vanadium-dependent haloperoxidase [Saprospiraceae bacterium]HNG88762.1 vanadium-dependent haloperoxidase [Saprospiraceae bacterium]